MCVCVCALVSLLLTRTRIHTHALARASTRAPFRRTQVVAGDGEQAPLRVALRGAGWARGAFVAGGDAPPPGARDPVLAHGEFVCLCVRVRVCECVCVCMLMRAHVHHSESVCVAVTARTSACFLCC